MLIEYKERIVYYKGIEVELEAGYFDKDYTIFNRSKLEKSKNIDCLYYYNQGYYGKAYNNLLNRFMTMDELKYYINEEDDEKDEKVYELSIIIKPIQEFLKKYYNESASVTIDSNRGVVNISDIKI